MTMRYAHLAPDAYDAAIDLLEGGQPRAEPVPAAAALAPLEDGADGQMAGGGDDLAWGDLAAFEEGEEVGFEEPGTSTNVALRKIEPVELADGDAEIIRSFHPA